MTYIEPVPERDASAELAGHYASDRAPDGAIRNYARAFSHRPDVYTAWKALAATLQERMEPRRYELATLAAARRLRSSYCMLAHGALVAERFEPPATVARIAADHRTAGLSEQEVAVMDLAEQVAADATAVTQADVDRLRALGFGDTEVFEVVAAAALRAFFSKVLDGLGAEPDRTFAELDPPLRDALLVGRPIAQT
jgi:uncharacterized peroxidase-related enzyme